MALIMTCAFEKLSEFGMTALGNEFEAVFNKLGTDHRPIGRAFGPIGRALDNVFVLFALL